MKRCLPALAAGLLSICSLSLAQLPSPNKGVPFTALETRTTTENGKGRVQTSIVARRSDGSTYRRLKQVTYNGVVDPNGSRRSAEFYDSGKHLLTTLDFSANAYLTVHKTLEPQVSPPALAARGLFVKDAPTRGGFNSPSSPHAVDLGLRKLDGLDAVGTLLNYPDGSSFEKWESPTLFLVLKSSSLRISPKADEETMLSEVQPGEPDAALFQIPAGFVAIPPGKHSS